jgi:hypothetical protein
MSLSGIDIFEITGISYHTFKLMKRYMACTDHEKKHPEKGEDDWDPLYLVRPLYDGFREQLRTWNKPGRHVAIDEFIISCKLRTFLQQMVKGKVCMQLPSDTSATVELPLSFVYEFKQTNTHTNACTYTY